MHYFPAVKVFRVSLVSSCRGLLFCDIFMYCISLCKAVLFYPVFKFDSCDTITICVCIGMPHFGFRMCWHLC